MENKQYIVAIEIGSSKIVGVLATKDNPNGLVSINHIEEVRATECVRYGCIKNVEEVKHHINTVISKLENYINGGSISSIYLNLAGRSVRNVTTTVNRHHEGETAITQATITSMLHDGRDVSMKGFDVLDVVPRKFLVDNVETKNPVGTFGSDITAVINAIVGKSTIKANLNRAIDPNVRVNEIILTPLAVADTILSSDEKQLGCMLLDFGAETTTISIYKNAALVYLATLPLGGRNITRDIMSLNILEDKAEDLKKTVGNAIAANVSNSTMQIDEISVGDVTKYVVARSGEIVANINEQLNIAGVKPEELGAGIILIGGGAKLNGFAELVEKTTQLKVRRGGYPAHVNILSQKGQNSDEYIQAVALATVAATKISEGDNCIILNIKPVEEEKAVPEVKSVPEVEVKPKEEKNEKKEKKQGFAHKLLDGFKDLFNDGGADDGDDNF